VPLVVIAPLVGIAIVPVTLPVGAGLTPSDVISVESIGIPAGPTDPPGLIPRGEVVPSEGIAVSGSSTSTWANAGPAHNKDQAVATISNGLTKDSPIRAQGFRSESIGRRHELRTNRILERWKTAAINENLIGVLRLQAASVVSGRTSKVSLARIRSLKKLERSLWIEAERERSLARRASWSLFALSRTRASRFSGCVQARR
jgi:hypothetical protein